MCAFTILVSESAPLHIPFLVDNLFAHLECLLAAVEELAFDGQALKLNLVIVIDFFSSRSFHLDVRMQAKYAAKAVLVLKKNL